MGNPWERDWSAPQPAATSAPPWERNWDSPPPSEAKAETDSSIPAAIADVPKEIASAYTEGVQHLTGNSVSDLPGYDPRTRGQLGPIEGLLRTGKQIIGVPETLMAPITGAARSLIGHPMADLEHKAGELIAPEIAAKDDPQKMYETAKGDVDLALSGARAATPKGPMLKAPTIPELKAASDAAYASPDVTSLELKPGVLKNYSNNTKQHLNTEGFDDIVAPKTFALLERVQNFPPSATVTGQNLNSLRKTLGKVASSNEPTEKAAASIAINHLDDFVPQIGKGDVIAGDPAAAAIKFDEARGNYAAAKQSEKIDKKVVRAEVRASAANSGMNVENAIRQRMADVVLNPKESRGLSSNEIAQAQTISEGTRLQNGLRFAGNALGGGGGIGAVITGIPSAGIAPAVGFGLKALSNHMTLQQAARLSEAIRMRAPLASSTAKFGQAFQSYLASRTPGTYAGVVVAARNLANNVGDQSFRSSISGLLRDLSNQERHQGE